MAQNILGNKKMAISNAERFRQRLTDAYGIQFMVAAWLVTKGYDAKVVPIKLPVYGNNKDEGDVEITLNMQIKKRNLDFTDINDYPFGSVLIDEVQKVERNNKARTYGYLILNKNCSHACFITMKSYKKWKKVKKYDATLNKECLFYEVDKNEAEFLTLECKQT